MKRSVYVGNLPEDVTESALRELFEPHGEVYGVSVITDRESGRPRGFAFVEMDSDAVPAAVAVLDGHEMDDHRIRVSQARPRSRYPMRRRPGHGGGGDRSRHNA
ncbi:MAG TPA: RNA-binding protein [Gammaproteobacteria bacterium]|nr:RNA-binding protein [Gammaproteobacteria bacterium]